MAVQVKVMEQETYQGMVLTAMCFSCVDEKADMEIVATNKYGSKITLPLCESCMQEALGL